MTDPLLRQLADLLEASNLPHPHPALPPLERKQVRIKCGFMIRRQDGKLIATTGDVSAGGAKFSVLNPVGASVEVLAGEHSAKASVLQMLQGGGQFTYRVKFEDAKAGEKVFDAIAWAA